MARAAKKVPPEVQLQFEPVSAMHEAEDFVSVAEFWTIMNGRFTISDIDWDDDQITASYIETVTDPTYKKDLIAEPGYALTEAREAFHRELLEAISRRSDDMSGGYPFVFDATDDAFLTLTDNKDRLLQAQAYFWLSFFRLLESSHAVVSINDDGRNAFAKAFEKAFEMACCHALAVRGNGPVWYLGSSRSVDDLIGRLGEVCAFVGNGKLKDKKELEKFMANSNDGGVDVLCVYAPAGKVTNGSNAFLLGATVQKSSRKNKIMTNDNMDDFANLFSERPLLPFHGVLAIPFDSEEAEAQRCRERDCIYLPHPEMLRHIGIDVSEPNAASNLRHVRRQLNSLTANFISLVVVATNGGFIPMKVA